MKKKLSFLLSGLILFLVNTGMKSDPDDTFVKFDESLLVSKYELTNEEYSEFLNTLKKTNQVKKFNEFFPDSSMWTEKFKPSFNVPFKKLYHNHPAYNDYPVVNINKKAIETYCNYMTNKYNKNPERKYKRVLFRLPTENEWKKCFSPLPGHKLPWYGNFPYIADENNQIKPLANLKVKNHASGEFSYIFDESLIAAPVGNYAENQLGIYDIVGNVAELTQEAKIKGGSWYNELHECYINKTQNYQLPDPRVGFRLIMEVIEK